jgi:hypothetical protein
MLLQGILMAKTTEHHIYINSDSSPLEVSMLFSAAVIQLLQYVVKLGDGPSPLSGVTETEMFLFLALVLQMGRDLRDKLTICSSKDGTVLQPHNKMGHVSYTSYIFLHFEDCQGN